MKLSLLSLMSLAAGATALPTNKTDFSVAAFGIYNSTSVHDNIHTNIMKVNTTNRDQIAGIPSCFNCQSGNAITSGMAAQAILWFCDRVAGMPFGNSGSQARGAYVDLNYINSPVSTYPNGKVHLSVFASPEGNCNPMVTIVKSDLCVANLWMTISQCETDGSDRKTGGYNNWNCLQYVIATNPDGCPAGFSQFGDGD
ncbi:hypothetical protein LTR22_012590 [Elasticomyces elasticus]|nr:hypothetical protein LTR22_012590 [Elasticomyces elasticus]KAK4911854.1 hypothetical protein LTR49_019654 [Elasticomyces elasticus]KAK5768282.1 hypothetical protein LTS12_001421 [Elasticomyces elasticus]